MLLIFPSFPLYDIHILLWFHIQLQTSQILDYMIRHKLSNFYYCKFRKQSWNMIYSNSGLSKNNTSTLILSLLNFEFYFKYGRDIVNVYLRFTKVLEKLSASASNL